MSAHLDDIGNEGFKPYDPEESDMAFSEYLKANYTAREIASMSREGLQSRRVMFMTGQPQAVSGKRVMARNLKQRDY